MFAETFHEGVNLRSVSFDMHFDPAIGQVLHGPRKRVIRGKLNRGHAKTYALYPA